MTKTILALCLLALVGCGSSSDDDGGVVPVTCPATLPTPCTSSIFTSGSGGQPITVESCGDVTLISTSTGTCCFQGEPADFVPTGTECN